MNLDFVKKIALDLFNTDSPTGYSSLVDTYLINILKEIGYEATLTNKGNVKVFIKGESSDKVIATSAHVDTLGLMVRSINGDGTLSVTAVGGPSIPTLDGEYCKIVTRDNKLYTGTILCRSASVHVYEDAKSKVRDLDSMIIRIDEKVKCKTDVEKLGISNGDYIFIDTKTVITESGFLTPFVDKTKGSLFSAVSYTEKPDVLSAKICEGKIGIMADGCPFALIYP